MLWFWRLFGALSAYSVCCHRSHRIPFLFLTLHVEPVGLWKWDRIKKCWSRRFATSQLWPRAVVNLMSLHLISVHSDKDLQRASSLPAEKWVKILLKMAEEVVVRQWGGYIWCVRNFWTTHFFWKSASKWTLSQM